MNGALDPITIRQLLKAMQARAETVKPKALGVLGEAHVRQVLTDCYGVDNGTLRYKCEPGGG